MSASSIDNPRHHLGTGGVGGAGRSAEGPHIQRAFSSPLSLLPTGRMIVGLCAQQGVHGQGREEVMESLRLTVAQAGVTEDSADIADYRLLHGGYL